MDYQQTALAMFFSVLDRVATVTISDINNHDVMCDRDIEIYMTESWCNARWYTNNNKGLNTTATSDLQHHRRLVRIASLQNYQLLSVPSCRSQHCKRLRFKLWFGQQHAEHTQVHSISDRHYSGDRVYVFCNKFDQPELERILRHLGDVSKQSMFCLGLLSDLCTPVWSPLLPNRHCPIGLL